jgi:hypothetical protein
MGMTDMKKSRFTEDRITGLLKQAEANFRLTAGVSARPWTRPRWSGDGPWRSRWTTAWNCRPMQDAREEVTGYGGYVKLNSRPASGVSRDAK